jgi:hypothetical protein
MLKSSCEIENKTLGESTLGNFLCHRLGSDFYGILEVKATFENKIFENKKLISIKRNKVLEIPINVDCTKKYELKPNTSS